MAQLESYLIARAFFGAVMTRTPSEERLEATWSGSADAGREYFLEKLLATILLPSSAFSSCFPSTTSTPSLTATLSSSGRYWLVSRLTSSLLSSSFTLITSLSLVLNSSMLVGKSVLRAGNIQRRGNIQPLSPLDFESCLIRDLLGSAPSFFSMVAGPSNMMLLDMQAMLRKSSSNFRHMSRLSVNMASLTRSKSSQLFLKKGSSKKKSLMVTGTLEPPDISLVQIRAGWC